jgi:hypothetical protein
VFPVHVVSARHGYGVLLRSNAKRKRKADTNTADMIRVLSAGLLDD